MKTPKRLSVEQIVELLGENTGKRLEVALLRQQASQLVEIEEADIDLARQYLNGERRAASRNAVRQCALKYIIEVKNAHKGFLQFLTTLTKAQPHGKKKIKRA
jgi:hypothetical protein